MQTNNKRVSPSTSCQTHINEYCANSSFGGFHYVADVSKHWTERLLWMGLIALCWYGSALLVISAWDAFQTNPLSFGVETTYLNWDTKMPSLAVCEWKNPKKALAIADIIWPPPPYEMEDIMQEITYFRGHMHQTIDYCYKHQKRPICPTSNFSSYADLVRSDCPDLLRNCSYNGKEFECCEFFLPISTDFGTCYIINTIQTNDPKPYLMINNRTAKKSLLRFEISVASYIYILDEAAVPTVTTPRMLITQLNLGHVVRTHITVKQIENNPLVAETTPEQRGCRFNDENKGGIYPHYSYSACTTMCRKHAQLKYCGCNDYFMPGTSEDERCNISGMACLHRMVANLTYLKAPWSLAAGLACDCLPSCDEAEIGIVRKEQILDPALKKRKRSVFELILAYLPTERFKRSVIRSRLDLVVSIGGTTGLLVGCSILSFVELIFYFTIRYMTNVAIARNNRKLQRLSKIRDAMRRRMVGALMGLDQRGGRFLGPYERYIYADKMYRY